MLKLNDLTTITNAQSLSNLFTRLGYEDCFGELETKDLELSEKQQEAIYRCYLIASYQQSDLQVILFELKWTEDNVIKTRLKSIAKNLSQRATFFLVLGTTDYQQLSIVTTIKRLNSKMELEVINQEAVIHLEEPEIFEVNLFEKLATFGQNARNLYHIQHQLLTFAGHRKRQKEKPLETLSSYLKTIGKIPLLKAEDEILLARKIQQLYHLDKSYHRLTKELGKPPTDQQWATALRLVDLVSLDEMRLPLIEFLQQQGQELVEEIPLGIHSTRTFDIPDPQFREGGVFLAFKSDDKHFWYFYPKINGSITTDPAQMLTEKRKIFNWLKCKSSDFPDPDTLKPVKFDNSIFAVIEPAIDQILSFFKRQQTAAKVTKKLNKTEQKIVTLLQQNQASLFDSDLEPETLERVLKVINTIVLKSSEKEIKRIWGNFTEHKQANLLCEELDLLFAANDYYNQIEDELTPLKIIKREEIQLVCFEWFRPE